MKRTLLISWLVLLLLTTCVYVGGANRGSEASLWFVIPLLVALFKIGVVAWYFMELRTVSRLWAVGMCVLTASIFVMAAILQHAST